MAERVLITGVNGFIGRHVAKSLVAAGHRVAGCSLEPSAGDLPSSVEYHATDLTDYAAVESLLTATQPTAIVHLAAIVHTRRQDLTFVDYARVNYRASEHLFECAAEHGVKRLVFASTVEVYGPIAPGEIVDESRPCRPDSDYARTKVLAEEALQRLAERHSLEAVILRFAPVYGQGFRLNFDKRLYLQPPRIGYRVGSGEYRFNLCSIRNIEHFVARWLELPKPGGGVFNLADRAGHSIRELHQLERQHGNARWVLRLPLWPCLVALSAREVAYSLLNRDVGMYTSANFRKLANSVTWRSDRAERLVGTLPGDIARDLYSV